MVKKILVLVTKNLVLLKNNWVFGNFVLVSVDFFLRYWPILFPPKIFRQLRTPLLCEEAKIKILDTHIDNIALYIYRFCMVLDNFLPTMFLVSSAITTKIWLFRVSMLSIWDMAKTRFAKTFLLRDTLNLIVSMNELHFVWF